MYNLDTDNDELGDENEREKQHLKNLHKNALEMFKVAANGWKQIREEAAADLEFFEGKQYDVEILQLARLNKEPLKTENVLPSMVQQVENEFRQREMSINAHALDENGSDDTANIFTSLIRAIEQESHAKSQYVHVFGHQGSLVPGFGFLKLDVSDDKDGQRKVSICAVKDPFKVLPDPETVEPDMSDADYWFEFEDYSTKTFKRLFPKSKLGLAYSHDLFPEQTETSLWFPDGSIRVARFWYKERLERVDYLLEDGEVVTDVYVDTPEDDEDDDHDESFKKKGFKYDFNEDESKIRSVLNGDVKVVLRHVTTLDEKIKWVDMTGGEILDTGTWIDDKFPFSASTGITSFVNGKKTMRGIIRFVRDAQEMVNYLSSAIARRVASANKSPWIVDPMAIQNYQPYWNTMNVNNFPWLPADSSYIDETGNRVTLPAPQRADQTSQIQDLIAAKQLYLDAIKMTLGIYDAGLGATPNEQSGVAIKTLAQQGMNANFHFSDNFVRCLQHLGRLLISIIPKVYDAPRVVRVVGAEGNTEIVKINQLFQENGKKKIYNLTEGDYGLTVNVGPAYANQKQESIEQMLELCRANPNITPVIQDRIAAAMKFPGSEIVADRLFKLLAQSQPSLIEGTPQSELPPEALAVITQTTQLNNQLTQELQQTTAKLQELQFKEAAKITDTQGSMELERLRSENALKLEEYRRETAALVETQRAAAEKTKNESDLMMKQIQVQLQHQSDTMKLIIEAVKQFGPMANEVIQNVVPPAVATMENAQPNNAAQ